MRQQLNSILGRYLGVRVVRSKLEPKAFLYGLSERPDPPRFLNVGAGSWSHPFWHNLENPRPDYEKSKHADISFDLTSGGRWPIADHSLEIVYTSHTIEHLNDKFVDAFLREAYRTLSPGGVIRITCPDFDLYTDAFERGDDDFFKYAVGSPLNKPLPHGIQQALLHCFVGPLGAHHKGNDLPKVSDAEVDAAFSSMDRPNFLDHFSARIPDELVRKYPKHHKTWFTVDKLRGMLTRAGFRSARRSAYGQSASSILRDVDYFDRTHPALSLYVEASR